MGEKSRIKKAEQSPGIAHKVAKPERDQDETIFRVPASLEIESVTGLQDEMTAQGLRHEAILEMQQRYGNIYSRKVIGGLDRGRGVTSTSNNALLQRAPSRKLDKKAQAIVKAAGDTSKKIEERAIQVVKDIINTYYPSQSGLVKKIKYDPKEIGLSVDVAKSKKAKGIIYVGDYFVNHTTKKGLARRVLQVDHELEHIRQHRGGLGGKKTKALREFLAYHREGLSPELPGTGRISHSTRVALIDGALKNYYKMGKGDRKKHKKKRDELLKARTKHASKSNKNHPPPPGP
jgi:hypothetical protein